MRKGLHKNFMIKIHKFLDLFKSAGKINGNAIRSGFVHKLHNIYNGLELVILFKLFYKKCEQT